MKPHPLKVEREQRGWSQRKIAKVLGIHARTVSRWESGLDTTQLDPYQSYLIGLISYQNCQ